MKQDGGRIEIRRWLQLAETIGVVYFPKDKASLMITVMIFYIFQVRFFEYYVIIGSLTKYQPCTSLFVYRRYVIVAKGHVTRT